MRAILKRELSAYFNSAIAYIVMAVFFGFSGFFFWAYCFMSNSSSLSGVFGNVFYIILFIIPIISMKAFSEEKKQKTDQALLTSPTSLFEIVMGKFLGAYILYAICCVIFFIYAFIIAIFTAPEWPVIICTIIGLMLLGGLFIAIDIFVSALTESQVIAAVVGIAVGLLLSFMPGVIQMIEIEWIANVLQAVSPLNYYSVFTYGMLDFSGIVFFLSVIALFIFLTIRVLDRKRWS